MSKGHSKEEEAKHLHQAIEAKDLGSIIRIIARNENEDLQDIAHEYNKHFGQALAEAVKTVAHGEFGIFLVNLIMPRASFAARTINNAVEGAGTDEAAIIDIVVHITNKQIQELKEAYSNIYMKDLVSRIKSDVSGHFGKAVVSILEGLRSEGKGNPAQEAEELYKKGEGKWGTDDDYFVHFFTKHSYEALVEIDHEYNKKYGHGLEAAIKKETSGAYEDILVALAVSREVYWARRIRHAIAGLGTNDVLLRRAFALNSKSQLRRIEAVYESVNKGKTLRADVEHDTSGEYKTLFLGLIDSN
jgi:hypothetical protein